MGRGTKKVIARMMAVLLTLTLLPFDLWGTAEVVMAEELSEVCTEEDADVETDAALTEENTDAPDEETNDVSAEEVTDVPDEEASVTERDDREAEDVKAVEVEEEKKEEEKASSQADNKALAGFVHNFTTDGHDSDDFFTITGKKQSKPTSFSYIDKFGEELTLSAALKMESSTTISFNAKDEGTLVLVIAPTETGTIKVDGTATTPANGIIEVELAAGSHEVKKGSGTSNLYYIAFISEAKDTVSTPTASPENGEVKLGDTIELACTTADATIYYTTDGSEPKENQSKSTYSNGITIAAEMIDDKNQVTIKAYAVKDDCTDSETAAFTYTVSSTPSENQLERPTAEPDSGEVPKGTEVILKSNEENAAIYYTLDETTPTKENGTLFDEANPIVINDETTIKAVATKDGMDNSFVATFAYTIKKPKISVDLDSKDIISTVEMEGDVSFVNQDNEEVFDVKLKAQENTVPSDDIKQKAEELAEDTAKILYYDVTLINADTADDTVTLAGGTLKIKMPYSITTPKASKRNEIIVLHNTETIEISKDSDGFSFYADSFSPYTVIINPVAGIQEITISESAGYEEGVYAEWEPVDGADGYMAYVAKAGGEFERIDNELIREYSDYWRVDTVGLAKGTYYLKINAVVLDTEDGETTATVIATNTTEALKVTNYDRSGFAFSANSPFKTGSGAYNDDGTLKAGAQVVYVTADTAKTCTALLHTNGTSKEAVEITGLQSILDAKQKGDNTKNDILDIRIIGCVTRNDLDHISSSEEGLQIKGKNEYSEMNITIEGIGEDAVVKDFGFLIRNCGNVELRNFAIMAFMDDGVSMDTKNCNIWVHDLDIFYGVAGGDTDQAKGDGSVDIKNGTTYVTVAYNHFWDSGKCSLCGMEAATADEFMVTYHHNWFDHSDSRHPRVRRGSIHIYNNYFDGNAKYGVGAANASSIFVEANYFRNCNYPMIISTQASDALGGNIMSSEAGGIIKAYNNTIIGAKNLVYRNSDSGTAPANATSFDAFLVANRADTVPDTVVTLKGGTSYNNFDTSPSYDLGVTEDNIDTPENVPNIVMAKAGRLNGGDFKWEFDDAEEDTNYSVIKALKEAVVGYTTTVKMFGGGVAGEVTIVDNDDSNAPSVGSQTVSAPRANVVSGEVEKGTEITLTSDTSGAEIYYTLDGFEPTADSTRYTSAIVINENTTIKAIAVLEGSESAVSTFKYTIPSESIGEGDAPGGDNQPENTTIETYEFNPEGLKMTAGTVIPAADTQYGTKNYFTIGNSNDKASIKATSTSGKATKAPIPSKSKVSEYSVRYQFGGAAAAADDPKAIRFTTANKARVSVAAYRNNDSERNLYLDTDENVKVLTKTATEYTFDIVEAGTHGIYAKDGDIAILYVIVEEFVPIIGGDTPENPGEDTQIVEAPTANVNSGVVPVGTTITLSCATDGAKIYYTTDQTEPTAESTIYDEAKGIVLDKAGETVIKAIAVKDNAKSSVVTLEYTVSAEIAPDKFVSAPVSNVNSGKVPAGTQIALTSATADAKIYYTIDGTEPTVNSILYTEAISLGNDTKTVIIKAIAVKGENVSAVSTFEYTILEAPDNPDNPDAPVVVKTIKLDECEITVPSIMRDTSKKADAKQPSVTYVTYTYTDGHGDTKHVKFAEGLDYSVVWNGPESDGDKTVYSVTLKGLGREADEFTIDTESTKKETYKVYDKQGKGNTIKVVDISKANISLDASAKTAVYTGYAVEPGLNYSKDKNNLNGKLNIAYRNNINAGKATVIISAKPDAGDENTVYIGSKTLTFTIKKAALNKIEAKATAKVVWDESFSFTAGHDYTGTPVTVTGLKVESGKGRTLKLDEDYTVTYKNNANAGKATVTVKGIGNNLSGSWTQSFTINSVDLSKLKLNKDVKPVYSPKGARLAEIEVLGESGEKLYTLKEDTDYTAKYVYSDKKKAAGSKVTVTISGKGACTGKNISLGEFEIAKADFAVCVTVPEDIAVDGKDIAKELAKAITVTDASGAKLSVKKNYTIGTPDKETKTVELKPVDTRNYENSCIVKFRVATNLAKDKGFVFDKKASLSYDGRNPVKLTADDITKYVGAKYKLGENIEIVPGTYKNNTKKGTASVTVRGKAGVDGGFHGTKVLKFKIVEK